MSSLLLLVILWLLCPRKSKKGGGGCKVCHVNPETVGAPPPTPTRKLQANPLTPDMKLKKVKDIFKQRRHCVG